MAVKPVESLVSSLGRLDVPYERTTSGEFRETFEKHIDEPVVGVELYGTDVSLESVPVTVDPTPAELKAARTGITPASFAVADYGSVAIPSTTTGSELVSLFVDRHVAVIDESDILPDMESAFDRFGDSLRADRGSSVIATGPSATADMGALVRGAHGPSDVRVIILESTDE